MFKQPYDTSLCKQYVLTDLKVRLMELYMADELRRVEVSNRDPAYGRLLVVDSRHTDIKAFTQVIELEVNGTVVYVADARSSSRISPTTGELIETNDYRFLKLRMILQCNYWGENRSALVGMGHRPMAYYTTLLTNNLSFQLRINPENKQRVSVIIALFYLWLYEDADEYVFDDEERMRLTRVINQHLRIDNAVIISILSELEPFFDIKGLAKALAEHSGSIRLAKITPAVIYTAAGNIWFGSNFKEHIAVALEYPPTWLAMLTMSITNKAYRQTALTKLVALFNGRGEADDLGNRILRLAAIDSN